MKNLVLALIWGVFCLGMGVAQAREQIPSETRIIPLTANLPACADAPVIAFIAWQFRQREEFYWGDDAPTLFKTGASVAQPLQIAEIVKIRQTAMRPNGLDLIPRRYCAGTAILANGARHGIDYSIVENAGIIGATWGVIWCVQGLDRNYAFAPNCLMARP